MEQAFFVELNTCLASLRKEDHIEFEINMEKGLIKTKNESIQKTKNCVEIRIDDDTKELEIALVTLCYIPAKAIIQCIIDAAKRVGIQKIKLTDESDFTIRFEGIPQRVVIDLAKISMLKYGKTYYSHHFGFERIDKPVPETFLDEVLHIISTKTLPELIIDSPIRIREQIFNLSSELNINPSSNISNIFQNIFDDIHCVKKVISTPMSQNIYGCVANPADLSRIESLSKLVNLVWEIVARHAGGDSDLYIDYELIIQKGGRLKKKQTSKIKRRRQRRKFKITFKI